MRRRIRRSFAPSAPTAIKRFDFGTFGVMIDFAINRERATFINHSREAGSAFRGFESFDDAVNLARNGWPQGSEKIARLSNVLTDKITSLIDATTINYDVTGTDFDVAMYLQDVPEYWTTLETCEGASNRTLRVIFNCAASAGISADILTAKGAAIVALIAALETASIRVELDLTMNARGSKFQACIMAKIKDADQPLDIDRLAFALAHPATLRRLCLAVMESDAELMQDVGSSYGLPTELKDVPKDAIYIGQSFLGQPQWTNETETLAWIKSQLKAQGVHLSE